jgi:hypothetical protein
MTFFIQTSLIKSYYNPVVLSRQQFSGYSHDKRIELPITGLLPLNRRKNAAAWKAQGIEAEFHGISRRGSPWNWSG